MKNLNLYPLWMIVALWILQRSQQPISKVDQLYQLNAIMRLLPFPVSRFDGWLFNHVYSWIDKQRSSIYTQAIAELGSNN